MFQYILVSPFPSTQVYLLGLALPLLQPQPQSLPLPTANPPPKLLINPNPPIPKKQSRPNLNNLIDINILQFLNGRQRDIEIVGHYCLSAQLQDPDAEGVQVEVTGLFGVGEDLVPEPDCLVDAELLG